MITWDGEGGLRLILTLSKLSVEFTRQVKRSVSLLFGGAIMPCPMKLTESCKMDSEASRITKLTALLFIPGPSW